VPETVDTVRFVARLHPSSVALSECAALALENPFATEAYARFREVTGDQTWTFELRDGDRLVDGCVGFERTGRMNRSLEVASLPALPVDSPFWEGLLRACRRRHVTQLELNSFASTATAIPALPGESWRRARAEYVLDLDPDKPLDLSTNHRRSLARARGRGLTIRRSVTGAAAAEHDELMRSSMVRRAARGEAVDVTSHEETTRLLLASGAGELFQAVDGDVVLSSVLVLRSATGGYYQSAGTSPAGMECGASPFLIASIAACLARDGARRFNLGGAGPDNPGLQRFKSGFGAREIPLEAAGCCPSGAWRVALAARALRWRQRASSVVRALRARHRPTSPAAASPTS
jgi:hypothetical protein